ncbi:RidA family protein [Meiothermus cerbereus]|uniref:RidA family protein n=1 Tax=Meiothermus cerbereus TaxID=65552 RepID=UPI003EEA9A0D
MKQSAKHFQVLQPQGWPMPRGYANGIVAQGRLVFLAGMVGWNRQRVFESDDFAAQTRQALQNILETLAEAGGRPEHLVRLTWFVTSKQEYLDSLPALGEIYRALMGRHYPAMSVVEVKALMEAQAKVEIEATAVIPE